MARACDADLQPDAQEYLFSPTIAEVGDDWIQDRDGYCIGLAGIHSTARDMARFGSSYLNGGQYQGNQVLSASWVRESLERYSEGMNFSGWIPGISSRYGYFRDLGCGYQWWSATASEGGRVLSSFGILRRVGDRYFNYASGHGGQLIVLLDELDMVTIAVADPFWQQQDAESWKHERAINNLVAKFIKTLPKE